MKNIYKIFIALLAISLLFSSCSPDEPKLGSLTSANDIDISVTQNADKDNIIYLKNNTKGIIPYWDYVVGYTNEQTDTVTIRFAGDYTITFTAFDNGGTTSVTKQITVSENDEEYFEDPMWNLLTNGTDGKTWVWDDTKPAVYGNGSFGSVAPEWWLVPMSDVISWGWEVGDMTFNLNGAQNFTKVLNSGSTSTGFFELDVEKKQLKINNSNILYGADYADDGAFGTYYAIVVLTETEMVLARQGDGWQNTWMFRVK